MAITIKQVEDICFTDEVCMIECIKYSGDTTILVNLVKNNTLIMYYSKGSNGLFAVAIVNADITKVLSDIKDREGDIRAVVKNCYVGALDNSQAQYIIDDCKNHNDEVGFTDIDIVTNYNDYNESDDNYMSISISDWYEYSSQLNIKNLDFNTIINYLNDNDIIYYHYDFGNAVLIIIKLFNNNCIIMNYIKENSNIMFTDVNYSRKPLNEVVSRYPISHSSYDKTHDAKNNMSIYAVNKIFNILLNKKVINEGDHNES